ncbi:LAME_0G13520g1_1 [Lachancea meyersii CBS 8951]|uniref:LAME_0G13520g1_1 n=1 Tax=Lachancea meyersii CBS 8951 TaxID=1266667 RepID=A0A1G4KA10_9SACH|nr:LAME_0G13520g1_1 [Lachancea meyersii CBS 8951]
MSHDRKLRSENVRQESDRRKGRSHSPSLFFRNSSSSNLLKIGRPQHLANEARQSRSPRKTVDSRTTAKEHDTTSEKLDAFDSNPLITHQSNMMVEVLPSFELYNTLHRHIPQGNVDPDRIDFPPTYQEVQTESPSMAAIGGNLHFSDPSETSVQPLDAGDASAVASRIAGDQMYSLEALRTSHGPIEPIQDDMDEADNINIDKIYSLPKLSTPIDINIHVTKEPAGIDKKVEDESILREYTSGDIIHGYVTVENRSPQPLKFEMFYVTLEGHSTVIDRECGKRTVKRFLRMVDLSASWSYSNIDVSNGLNYFPGRKDFEDCVMGLNNNRILAPNTRYKKYFMFKLPTQLLDVSCKHQQFSHCLVPPTFGIDSWKSGGKYAGIKINPMLGYGHLGTKGSPILTDDLSPSEMSIGYVIDTKVVGKDARTRKLNILREREYNLRFVPFGFCRPFTGERAPFKQLQDITRLVQERLDALRKVMKRLEQGEQITNEDLHNTDISGSAVDLSEIDSEEILRLKLNQLYTNNRIDPVCSSFPLSNSKISKANITKTVETEFRYRLKDKNRSSTKLKKSFFAGLGGSTSSSSSSLSSPANKSGIIVITSDIPKAGLPYTEPSLLKKTNRLENKGAQNRENWDNLISSLPDKDKEVLNEVTINMKCIQASNCGPHEPPEVQSVTTELVCMTLKSTNSIPIKLDAEFVSKKKRFNQIQSSFLQLKQDAEEFRSKFEENQERLNGLFRRAGRSGQNKELKFSDFIPEQMLNDIESIATLRSHIQVLPQIFKKQSHTLKDEDDHLDPPPLKSSSSTSILSATFSGSSSSNHHTPTAERLRKQLFNEWVKSSDQEYDRTVVVNLVLSDDIRETLIPTFESCLISRLYCIRVNIKFEGQSGVATIDIPAQIRRLEP